ncbi:MAG: hypothetical protein Q8918_08775 [Bacteroidota bacterium]|nr:hypothetical protein [Bacteroidota bacterium]MDP4250186.1 hypothetical protein [Bacteroidota bacterium]
MKNSKWLLLMALILTTATAINAQKVKLIDGDLSPLKSEKSIVLAFSYDPMKVGKFDRDGDYVSSRKQDLNSKEPGRGDTWANSWVADRAARYEPKFTELFEKYSVLAPAQHAKYTLIFKTTFTEPGWNVGVMKKSALIDAEAWIVESDNKDHVVAKISVMKSPGRTFWGSDYDTGVRIEEAYAAAGKAVGRFLKDKL